ncbi:hypothetical protein Tco_1506718 [Tanacetum coccineum]
MIKMDSKPEDDEDAGKNDVDETTQDDEDDDDHDDDEKVQDDNEHDVDKTTQEDDDEEQTESDDDGDDFVAIQAPTMMMRIIHEEYSDEDDSSISTSNDEDSDNEDEGTNVEGAKLDEEATYEEDQGNEAVKDTTTDLDGRDKVMTDVEDTHVTLTPVNPDGQQQSFVDLLDPSLTSESKPRYRSLSSIPGIVDQYLANKMQEAVDVAVQLKYDRIREESDTANQQFLNSIDEGMKKLVIEQLESEVLVRSSKEANTSHAVAANLSENAEKDLIDKMDAKTLSQDTYGDTVTIKRMRREQTMIKKPYAGQTGSKRRGSGKCLLSYQCSRETTTRQKERLYYRFKITESASHLLCRGKLCKLQMSLKHLPAHQEFETGVMMNKQKKRSNIFLTGFNNLHDYLLLIMHGISLFLPFMNLVQPWLSNLARRQDPLRCKKSAVTKAADYGHIKWIEDLVPNSMWSQVIVHYDKFALWGVSHWGKKRRQFYAFAITRESARDVYSKRRIVAVTKVEIVEWQNYKHLDWITVRRDDDILYKFKEGDFHRLRIQDIEDMLLLLVQGKVTNLNIEERIAFNVSLRMFTRSVVIQRRVEDLQLGVESYQKKLNLTKPDTYRSNLRRRDAYTPYSDPRGFIYENKDKKNRLMRIDELHKFSDGTLDDVRTALNDRLKGIRMEYLPQTFWSQRDKANARAMIQAIDKRLKTRRIMRSLERFVGGRPYGGDLRLLQRTI